MKSICIFCGSSSGAKPEYMLAAYALGEALARRHLRLIYGGASVGMMGELANTALAEGAEVIGVIPRAMAVKEIAHTGLTDLRVVETMHERKALMGEMADGFIALPGGLGTLDEFFEVLTWAQLGLHQKPCGLLNVGGFFDHLIAHLDRATADRFVHPAHRNMILIDADPGRLLDRLATDQPPKVEKWLDRKRPKP